MASIHGRKSAAPGSESGSFTLMRRAVCGFGAACCTSRSFWPFRHITRGDDPHRASRRLVGPIRQHHEALAATGQRCTQRPPARCHASSGCDSFVAISDRQYWRSIGRDCQANDKANEDQHGLRGAHVYGISVKAIMRELRECHERPYSTVRARCRSSSGPTAALPARPPDSPPAAHKVRQDPRRWLCASSSRVDANASATYTPGRRRHVRFCREEPRRRLAIFSVNACDALSECCN